MRRDRPTPPGPNHRHRLLRGSRDGSARRSTGPTQTALERLLREAYAAPADPVYWDQLEARIMASVQPTAGRRRGTTWTAGFGIWARAGMAAACAAAVAAGLATWSINKTEARVAYETVLDVRPALPVQSDTRFIDVSDMEATNRYVLSH
jgi:hypothetical protein